MKRPRRPTKKAARKVAPKRKPNKIIRGLKQALDFARADLFDIPKPPAGFAYQWSPVPRTEYMLSKGWTRVPYSRHPEMPLSTNFDGYVVYLGCALFQISEELARSELDRLRDMAKDQVGDFNASIGRDEPGRGFYILPPSFMVDTVYERVAPDAPPVSAQLTITFMVPARWQDTANALGLETAEYARRRVAMEGLLLAVDPEGKFHPFELTTRKID